MNFIGDMEGGTYVPNWIDWLIVSISLGGLLIIWFMVARTELEKARQSVNTAIRQIELHMEGCTQCVGQYKEVAMHSLNISRLIYREAVKNYETIRYKPLNRIPAFLLGYRTISEPYEQKVFGEEN